MSLFLGLQAKKILIFGISNRKSIAFSIAKILEKENAEIISSVQNDSQKDFVNRNLPNSKVFVCDVTDENKMAEIAERIKSDYGIINGIVHSIAFANFAEGIKPFHETRKDDFFRALDVSCFSFIKIANLYKNILDPDGSLVTISISTTRMAAESYGYMAPIKAALDSSVVFLAKSLSQDSRIRVNAVGASLLKTSSSAGIPGYLEPYMFAEMATLRKKALQTEEVANIAVFLLSAASSGINAQTIVVDAGMSVNFFDKSIVNAVVKNI